MPHILRRHQKKIVQGVRVGRVWSARAFEASITGVTNIWTLSVPNAPAWLVSVRVGQSSEWGAAQHEMLPILIRRQSTSGAGGTLRTELPHDPGDAGSGVSPFSNRTAGTVTATFNVPVWNTLFGWWYSPPPKRRILIPAGGILGIHLAKAPADAISIYTSITYGEFTD